MNDTYISRYSFWKTALSLALVLFLLTVMESLNQSFPLDRSTSQRRIEINAASREPALNAFNYQDIPALSIRFQNSTIAYKAEVESVLQDQTSAYPVKLVLTNESYKTLANINITRGTYFNENSVKDGSNAAVISEDLASKLFMSLNAVGNDIDIMGQTYKIVGVYKKADSLVAFLNSDGSERVYVPLTSFASPKDLTLSTIMIDSPPEKGERFRQKKIESLLIENFGIAPGTYKVIVYEGAVVLLSQFEGILIFFLAVWIIVRLFRLLLLFIKRRSKTIKGLMSDYYFFGLLKKKPAVFLKLLFGTLALLSLAASIFVFARPNINIPTEYMPSENLFDLKFYFNEIKTAIEIGNATRFYTPTETEQCLKTLLSLNLFIIPFLLISFASLCSGLKLMACSNTPIKAYLLSGLSSLGFFLIFGMLGVVLGFLQLILPLKGMVILALFVAVFNAPTVHFLQNRHKSDPKVS